MCEEIFGPVVTVYVYPEKEFEETLELCNTTSPYALTGAHLRAGPLRHRQGGQGAAQRGGQLLHQRQADRRGGGAAALRRLARLGHQRQGGKLAQPGALDLHPRIKETFLPPTDYRYPFLGEA